jgi:hypothetical protein
VITSGVAKPSFVVSNELNGLEGAPDAYKKFDQRIEGYSKASRPPGFHSTRADTLFAQVLLHPHAK